MRHRCRSSVVATALAGILVVATASVAWAHVHADPDQVEPGERATVAFGIEHGCDASPTRKLVFAVPDGATDVEPVPVDGWKAKVKRAKSDTPERIVFRGHRLPSAEEGAFEIEFTAPSAETVLAWKLVQHCKRGALHWVDVAEDGEPEPEYPAPLVGVGIAPGDHDDGGDGG